MAGRSTEKSLDFGGSSGACCACCDPSGPLMVITLLLAVASVTTTVLGPRILGQATDLIFAGVIGRQAPAGATKAEVVDRLRDNGQNTLADLLSSVNFVPGHGIDFGKVGTVLVTVLALFLVAAVLGRDEEERQHGHQHLPTCRSRCPGRARRSSR